jgi:hypothetical protein
MFVAVGMARAFIATDPARIGAGAKELSGKMILRSSVPCSQHSGREANIRAAEIQPDTLPQFVEFRLAKTSISASGAALRAVEA